MVRNVAAAAAVLLFLELWCLPHLRIARHVNSADLDLTIKRDHRLGSVAKALSWVYCWQSTILVLWLHGYRCRNMYGHDNGTSSVSIPRCCPLGWPEMPLLWLFIYWYKQVTFTPDIASYHLLLVSASLNRTSLSRILSSHPYLIRDWCVPVPSLKNVYVGTWELWVVLVPSSPVRNMLTWLAKN